MELGATLGSDVPACVLSRPALMQSRGERLTKAPPVPALSMVLVNPNVMLSTVDVFARVKDRSGVGHWARPPAKMETLWDVTAYLQDARNDLELPAAALAPVIDKVLDALAASPGCVGANVGQRRDMLRAVRRAPGGAECGRGVGARAQEMVGARDPYRRTRCRRAALGNSVSPFNHEIGDVGQRVADVAGGQGR